MPTDLRVAIYKLRFTSGDLRVAIYKLRFTSCDLRVAIYELLLLIQEVDVATGAEEVGLPNGSAEGREEDKAGPPSHILEELAPLPDDAQLPGRFTFHALLALLFPS